MDGLHRKLAVVSTDEWRTNKGGYPSLFQGWCSILVPGAGKQQKGQPQWPLLQPVAAQRVGSETARPLNRSPSSRAAYKSPTHARSRNPCSPVYSSTSAPPPSFRSPLTVSSGTTYRNDYFKLTIIQNWHTNRPNGMNYRHLENHTFTQRKNNTDSSINKTERHTHGPFINKYLLSQATHRQIPLLVGSTNYLPLQRHIFPVSTKITSFTRETQTTTVT